MTDPLSGIVTLLPDGIRLTIRAKPGLSRPRPPRIVDIGDGARALEVTVAAAAQDGKANIALCEQLAAFFGVRKGAVNLISGATGRLKIIEIQGDANKLRTRFISVCASHCVGG